MVPFYTGDYPDISFPVASQDFENAIRQHQDDQRAVLGPAAPAVSYNPQLASMNSTYPGTQPQLRQQPSQDIIMISRQRWEDTLSEMRQAKKERDELRMQMSTLQNELYTSRQVQKQLRMERDEVKGTAKSLRQQTAALADTQKRLRKERNEARIRVAILSNRGAVVNEKTRDPLAALLGRTGSHLGNVNMQQQQQQQQHDMDILGGESTRNTSEGLERGHGDQHMHGQDNNQGQDRTQGQAWNVGESMMIHDSPEDGAERHSFDPGNLDTGDEDQRLIDAFLAETNGGEDLSPEDAPFSPTTMAELFKGAEA